MAWSLQTAKQGVTNWWLWLHHIGTQAHSDDCAAIVSAQNGYDYGVPDYVDILPGSCSGICLAAIINLCFVVLTYLQPQSPARPVVQQKRGQQPKQTINNPQGFVWGCYGGLQHVPEPDADWSSGGLRWLVKDCRCCEQAGCDPLRHVGAILTDGGIPDVLLPHCMDDGA